MPRKKIIILCSNQNATCEMRNDSTKWIVAHKMGMIVQSGMESVKLEASNSLATRVLTAAHFVYNFTFAY